MSLQARPRSRLNQWRQRVHQAARGALPPGEQPYAGPVRLLITYYYEGVMPLGDIDNIIKPIQDALSGVVYVNDRQVANADCARCDINGPFRVRGMSPILAAAFVAGREFLHIKVDHPRDPQELRQ